MPPAADPPPAGARPGPPTGPDRRERWDERYRTGDLPWDTGTVSEPLQRLYPRLGLRGGRALELGCGTGTNALWLAAQGLDVTALDLSPAAVDQARTKIAGAAGAARIRLHVANVLDEHLPDAGSYAFVFDRGCFHSVGDDERERFAARVHEALAPGGTWLSLAGNKDEPTDEGPPRLSAAEIVNAVEGHFRVALLEPTRFEGEQRFLAWAALLTRRGATAEVSSRK